jgi:sugar lactone lactonase YvrE
MKAKPFISGLKFGEGVRWHDGRFWYSDFYRHQVSSVSPKGDIRVELEIDDQPSGLGWLPDGRLLVVAMTSQRLLRRETNGSVALHADLKPLAKFHANDMVVDFRGNAFVGCFGFDINGFIDHQGLPALFADPGPPTAPILIVSPEGKVSVASEAHRFPNGMVIVGDTLIAAETLAPGLTAFDLSSDGVLSNRRAWATLSKSPPSIVPDGICIDSEGAIWVANAVACEAVRIGKGGAVLERVETQQLAFSCALGGADGKDLVIATAKDLQSAAKETHGMLEIARVRVPR